MAGKSATADMDNAVQFYCDGATGPDAAKRSGVSATRLYVRLRELGIARRGHRLPLDDAAIVADYVGGTSELGVAKKYGVDRPAIRRRLIEAGVHIRSQSEAEALRWSQMTEEQRSAQVLAAHAAARGRTARLDSKVLHARTVMKRALHTSRAEHELARLLADRGIGVVHQHAIGPYNCDLGAYPVAVEIFGGEWHWRGRHLLRAPERFRYILNAGWHILVIKVGKRTPLTEWSADYVAGYIEEARSDPTRRREYRVVRGAGELLAAGSADDDDISIIPALRRGDQSIRLHKNIAR